MTNSRDTPQKNDENRLRNVGRELQIARLAQGNAVNQIGISPDQFIGSGSFAAGGTLQEEIIRLVHR